MLTALLDSKYENAICSDFYTNDDMRDMFKIQSRGDHVLSMDKNYLPRSYGLVAVGPVKLSSRGSKIFYRKVGDLVKKNNLGEWTYKVLSDMAEEIKLRAININGENWMEIDDLNDYKRALLSWNR